MSPLQLLDVVHVRSFGHREVHRLAGRLAPIDAANLSVEELIVDESGAPGTAHVVAAVSFPWRGATTIPMRALEWFTVRDGKVSEIQVFLWDTGAAVSALGSGAG